MAQLQAAQRRRRRRTRTIPAVVVVLAIALVLILVTGVFGGGSKKSPNVLTKGTGTTTASTAPPTSVKAASVPCPSFSGSSPRMLSFPGPPPLCIVKGGSYTETLHLNVGNVTVAFDTTKTPITANNFIFLSLYHYYDGTQLFRTDQSIGIIQGGSPHTESASDPGPGYTIPDEGSGYTYAPGDLVMARTSAPNSAGAQFFFCVTTACSNLNSQGTYVVFAHVTSGLPVLEKILASSVGSGPLGGSPAQTVTIESTTVTGPSNP
jgi:cyclophilin family peptidyl-prolyl cis-trans isomerase